MHERSPADRPADGSDRRVASELDAEGQPLHTRTLSVTLSHDEPPGVRFAAYVLDLRKRGFAPVAGDLQGTGIIHHMRLDGRIDADGGRLEQISAEMPTVAFEPSAASGFESCRDLSARVATLGGTALDDGYARRVGAEIGGPRGCSHVLTLAHLVGPTAAWALEQDRRLHGERCARRTGERIFRRDVTIDGYETADAQLKLTLQMSDLSFAPAPALAPPMDRFAEQLEVRVAATVTLSDLTVLAIDASERSRDADDFSRARWTSRSATVAPLRGMSLRAGVTAALYRELGHTAADRPLLEALLQLAPTTVQCFAAFADRWAEQGGGNKAARETGGLPDSCYMWRSDGALIRRRTEGAP
jgi:hypothetical protein